MSDPAASKKIWLLLGEKLGDNAQVELVAETLGLPFASKKLVVREPWRLGKPGFEADLHHIDLASSDRLEPPWPDLILTVGRRPAMAALWIKEQNGGRTDVVLFGRPKKWLDRFALVVAPSQYGIPAAANVMPIELPLMRVDEARLARGREEAREILSGMPRPVTAVLVGGRTKPYRFGAAEADRLLANLRAVAARDGGSFYVSTSRRSTAEVVERLAAGLPAGSRLYRFGDSDSPNPYAALLAAADRFVVSGDSLSMMIEVARVGRPLAIFELPIVGGAAVALLRRLALGLFSRGPLGRLGLLLFRARLLGFPRDLGAVHRKLYQLGAATPLAAGFGAPGAPIPHEAEAVAARIRKLRTPALPRPEPATTVDDDALRSLGSEGANR